MRAASSLRVRRVSNDAEQLVAVLEQGDAPAPPASGGSVARLRRTARCVSRSDARRLWTIERCQSRENGSGSNAGAPPAEGEVHLGRPLGEQRDHGREHGLVTGRLGFADHPLDVAPEQVLAPLPQVAPRCRWRRGRPRRCSAHRRRSTRRACRRRRARARTRPTAAAVGSVTSGFSPGESWRISLAIRRPPRMTDELDCSTPSTWTFARVVGQLGEAWPAWLAGGDRVATPPRPPPQGGTGHDAGAFGHGHGVDDGTVVDEGDEGARVSAGRSRRRAPPTCAAAAPRTAGRRPR